MIHFITIKNFRERRRNQRFKRFSNHNQNSKIQISNLHYNISENDLNVNFFQNQIINLYFIYIVLFK